MFIEFRKYKFVTGTTKKRLVTSFTHKYNRQKKSISDTFNRDLFLVKEISASFLADRRFQFLKDFPCH